MNANSINLRFNKNPRWGSHFLARTIGISFLFFFSVNVISTFAQLPDKAPDADCLKKMADANKAPETEIVKSHVLPEDDRLQQINAANPQMLVVRVKLQTSDPNAIYTAFAGVGKPIYRGSDISALAESLNAHAAAETKTLYVITKDFTNNKQHALEASLKIQQDQRPDKRELRVLGDVDLSLSFFDRAARLDSISKPEIVTEGTRRGWFRVLVDFTFGTGRAIRKGTLSVFCATNRLALDFISLLRERFTSPNFENTQSVAAIVDSVRQKLKQKYPDMTDQQIATDFREQYGKNYLVDLSLTTHNGG